MRNGKTMKVCVRGTMVALAVALPLYQSVYASTEAIDGLTFPQPIHYEQRATVEIDNTYDSDSPVFSYKGHWNTGYTQTKYDVVEESGKQVSYGLYWNSEGMRVNNNDIEYYDDYYGWVKVFAVNIDVVKQYGSVVTSEMLGSVIDVEYPDGEVQTGIILDVCGACSKNKKIDRYVYNINNTEGNGGHIGEVSFRFVRFGFDEYY